MKTVIGLILVMGLMVGSAFGTAALPTPGSSAQAGTWGTLINTWLRVEHLADGTHDPNHVTPYNADVNAIGTANPTTGDMIWWSGAAAVGKIATTAAGRGMLLVDPNSGDAPYWNGSAWTEMATGSAGRSVLGSSTVLSIKQVLKLLGTGDTEPNDVNVPGEVKIGGVGGTVPLYIRGDNSAASDLNEPSIRTGGGHSLSVNSGVWTESGSYGQLFLNGDQNSPVILGDGTDTTRRGWLGYGTTDPCYPVDVRETIFDHNHISKYSPVYNVLAWGATNDDWTDDYWAFAALKALVPDGATIYVPRGQYVCNSPWSFAGKNNIKIVGDGDGYDTIIYGLAQAGCILNLVGAKRFTVENIHFYASNPAGDPNCVIMIGRSDGASYGEHTFRNVWARGYCDYALVYSIAAENDRFECCTFSLDGGGATKTFATGQVDFLGLGGFTGSTNLTNWFTDCKFSNNVADGNCSIMYVYGAASCGDWVVRGGQWSMAGGNAFHFIQDHDSPMSTTGFTIEGLRIEATDSNSFLYAESNEPGTLTEIGRLAIRDCTWALNPGPGHTIYGTDDIRWTNCDISQLIGGAYGNDINVYNLEFSRVFLGNSEVINVRNVATNNVFFGGGNAYSLNLGIGSSGNLRFWNGKLYACDIYGGFKVLGLSGETAIDLSESDGSVAIDVNNNDFIRWKNTVGTKLNVVGVSTDDHLYLSGPNDVILRYNETSEGLRVSSNGCKLPSGLSYYIGSTSLTFQTKVLTVTIDVDDDASTDDYQFDDDAANTTKQTIILTNVLPATAELDSWVVECIEAVGEPNTMLIEIGTSSGGSEVATGSPDTLNEIISLAAGAAPALSPTNAARSLYVSGTPGANWDTLHSLGRFMVYLKYTDYGQAKTTKNP